MKAEFSPLLKYSPIIFLLYIFSAFYEINIVGNHGMGTLQQMHLDFYTISTTLFTICFFIIYLYQVRYLKGKENAGKNIMIYMIYVLILIKNILQPWCTFYNFLSVQGNLYLLNAGVVLGILGFICSLIYLPAIVNFLKFKK